MVTRRRVLQFVPSLALPTLLAGCVSLSGRDPIQVSVAGIEPLEGEGLELRFRVKLRVQNPNDAPIEYNGVYVELDVRGSRFATGVSDASGSVPRYGETVLAVAVSVSALRAARSALGFYLSSERSKVEYALRGKIAGPAFAAVRFESSGEMPLPAEFASAAQ